MGGRNGPEYAVVQGSEGYQFREPFDYYGAFSGAENDDIGLQNTYSWNTRDEYSIGYLGPTPGLRPGLQEALVRLRDQRIIIFPCSILNKFSEF